jgi:phosphatidylglycerol:prolipoprotein diacylglycerol transferase
MLVVLGLAGYRVFKAEILRQEAAGRLPAGVLSPVAGDFTVGILGSGLVGARLFHILEYWDLFLSDPIGQLTSRGGLTIFGGFIAGALFAVIYLRRKNIPIWSSLDAAAPAMMFGYALGRIGCQLSGDGDWGIAANMALKPSWLPEWFWAQTYKNNVVGIAIPEPGVYPTSVYESLLAFVFFAILWKIRAHRFRAGWLFCLYLVMNGTTRFFIEKIRVNSKYHLLGLEFTQAELISVAITAIGIFGLIRFSKKQLA